MMRDPADRHRRIAVVPSGTEAGCYVWVIRGPDGRALAHSPYISSWIEVLHNDTRAIFQAASFAEKAVPFLHGLQPDAAAAESEEIDAQ